MDQVDHSYKRVFNITQKNEFIIVSMRLNELVPQGQTHFSYINDK